MWLKPFKDDTASSLHFSVWKTFNFFFTKIKFWWCTLHILDWIFNLWTEGFDTRRHLFHIPPQLKWYKVKISIIQKKSCWCCHQNSKILEANQIAWSPNLVRRTSHLHRCWQSLRSSPTLASCFFNMQLNLNFHRFNFRKFDYSSVCHKKWNGNTFGILWPTAGNHEQNACKLSN